MSAAVLAVVFVPILIRWAYTLANRPTGENPRATKQSTPSRPEAWKSKASKKFAFNPAIVGCGLSRQIDCSS